MLWDQQITVYTDHKNLIQDALGLTYNRVYFWRLLLRIWTPHCVHQRNPQHSCRCHFTTGLWTCPRRQVAMMNFAQCWCHYTSGQEESTSPSAYTQESMNLVFPNQEDEEAIYPLMTREIAEAQSTILHSTQWLINMVIPHS